MAASISVNSIASARKTPDRKILIVEEHLQNRIFLQKVLMDKYDVLLTRNKETAYGFALNNLC